MIKTANAYNTQPSNRLLGIFPREKSGAGTPRGRERGRRRGRGSQRERERERERSLTETLFGIARNWCQVYNLNGHLLWKR